ncbi:unnamed protein product [Brassica napus]|uniref:(rape) hypothetical protein n=1 Tax=Brassica napus TaxID=3708 RepID=A0A816LJT5_BRANA|nr:unnamed protein product [Brassica napus]
MAKGGVMYVCIKLVLLSFLSMCDKIREIIIIALRFLH